MDDMVWFCRSKIDAKKSLAYARDFLDKEELLVKDGPQIINSGRGITFCGYKVLPHVILLGQRKKRLFIRHLDRWQSRYARGEITPVELQQGCASIYGGTVPAKANSFCRNVVDYLGGIEV